MSKALMLKENIIVIVFLSVLIFIPRCLAQNGKTQAHGFIVKPAQYKPTNASVESELGKALVKKNNCLQCHSINNQGGCLSPPLDGIGAYRNKQFILARITRSAAAEREFAHLYGQPELMPHLRVSPKDAHLIAQYLLTLPAPKDGFFVASHNLNPKALDIAQKTAPIATAKAIAEGKKLVFEHGCTACHSIYGIGGHFAPAFDHLSKYRTEEYVKRRITNVEFFTQNEPDEYESRGTVMPPSNLSVEDIDKISQFLMSL